MLHCWRALFFALLLLVSISSASLSYATTGIDKSKTSNILFDGTIDYSGCIIMGGSILNQTVNSQTIQVCQDGSYNFKITYSAPDEICAQVITCWTDPDTGKTFTFGNPCIAPQFYNMSRGSVTGSCPAQNIIHVVSAIDSPLKQLKNGVSLKNIICHERMVLMEKLSDNSPACVRPQTAQILVERGWGHVIN